MIKKLSKYIILLALAISAAAASTNTTTTDLSASTSLDEGQLEDRLSKLKLHLDKEPITVHLMKNQHIDSMKKQFINSFSHQYSDLSLKDLGKDKDTDPRTEKPFKDIPSWLEVVADGEVEEYLTQRENTNRIDIVGINPGGEVAAYVVLKFMNNAKVAYLAQGFIDPAYQGKKGESQFMQQVLPIITLASVDMYTLLVRRHNSPAIAAHKACGFSPLEEDLSARYARSLEYNPDFFVAMALARKAGLDAENYIKDLLS